MNNATLQQKFPALFAMYGAPAAKADHTPDPKPKPHPPRLSPVPARPVKSAVSPLVMGEPGPPELEAKIADLADLHKLRIRQLSQMMHETPLRPYLSADGNEAGIVGPQDWRDENPELTALFSDTFFGPSHAVICELFEEELKRIGETNGKNCRSQPLPKNFTATDAKISGMHRRGDQS